MDLTTEKCSSNAALLSETERHILLMQTSPWQYDARQKALHRHWTFAHFHDVMAFINAVAWIAHQADHHPDVTFSYNTCTISFQTHTVNDVSRNDFICAAKINALTL